MLRLTIKNVVRRMAPPVVKTPTAWPCANAQLGEVVECPGTRGNHMCKELIQIRAGTKPDKPSFGKMFVMHPNDDGGCGYFSYLKIDEKEPNQILLEEAVYQRSKRKMAVSKVPEGEIDPTDGGSVAKKQRTDQLETLLLELEGRVLYLESCYSELKHRIAELENQKPEEGEITLTPATP